MFLSMDAVLADQRRQGVAARMVDGAGIEADALADQVERTALHLCEDAPDIFPIMPSETSWMPEKNMIETISDGSRADRCRTAACAA